MNALNRKEKHLGNVDSLRAFTAANKYVSNDVGNKALSIGTTIQNTNSSSAAAALQTRTELPNEIFTHTETARRIIAERFIAEMKEAKNDNESTDITIVAQTGDEEEVKDETAVTAASTALIDSLSIVEEEDGGSPEVEPDVMDPN